MPNIKDELSRMRSSSLVRNAGWMFLGQGLSLVCQALYFLLLARLLGSTEYGIFVGVFAMVAVLTTYTPLGTQFVMLRKVSEDPSEFASYWGNVLAMTFTLGTLFVGLLVWVVPHIASQYSRRLIFCAALADCLCGQLTDVSSRVFQAFEKMRISAMLGLLVNLLRTITVGILLWRLHHATAGQWASAAVCVSILASVSALALVTVNYGLPGFSFKILKKKFGDGVVFALSSSTTSIYNNIDKAMLGHYGMNTANGIYAMAYRVIDISTIPIASIHAAAFPRFFRKGKDGPRSTTTFALTLLKRTAPMAAVLIFMMCVCAPFIPRLAGHSFKDSTVALYWLCPIPLFRSFQLSAGDGITGAGYLRSRLTIQAAAAIFNFGINLYMIPRWGWRGAAWSSLMTDGGLAVCNWTALLFIRSRVGATTVTPELPEENLS